MNVCRMDLIYFEVPSHRGSARDQALQLCGTSLKLEAGNPRIGENIDLTSNENHSRSHTRSEKY